MGEKIGKILITHCGQAEAVFKEKRKTLESIPEIGPVLSAQIWKKEIFKRVEKELMFMEQHQVSSLFYFHDDYPSRLKQCVDAPLLLYYKGNANLQTAKILSIIGTRKATKYGKDITEQIIRDLSHHQVLIISGLAYGIDTYAHRYALQNSLPTIGVLGHGLDTIYPTENRALSLEMLENGGLISEYPSFTKLDPGLFPRRNRIVAGMSDAVLVVEAAQRGGALITATIANSYNRDVFAIPGRIGDMRSKGCNNLITENKAALVQSASDICDMLGWNHQPKQKNAKQRSLFIELPDDARKIMDFFQTQQADVAIDDLCKQIDLPLSKITCALLTLEMENLIEVLPGKKYRAN